MRIAFFGGSFDPPHRGHLAIARAAIERLALDTVWMAPVGVQPLKPGGFSTSFADRLAMVELAAAGDPRIVPSAIDAPRSDGQPNYTIDVLTAIKASLRFRRRALLPLGRRCLPVAEAVARRGAASFSLPTSSSPAAPVSRSRMSPKRCPLPSAPNGSPPATVQPGS